MAKSRQANRNDELSVAPSIPGSKALVFISHDTRDAPLAETFSVLLSNVTCGMLKSFRSSDKSGKQGLEYGSEWYPEIMKALETATDVVCLLTQNSLGRPWILYEAGVAKGKLETPVHGLALGVPLAQASSGPFAQFQNCDGSDADSVSKLVMQLAKRLPNADPQKSIVDSQVAEFMKKSAELLQNATSSSLAAVQKKPDESSAAKLFEEIKVMFQELPDRMGQRITQVVEPRTLTKHRDMPFHPRMFEMLVMEGDVTPAIAWLVMISPFREAAPWAFELGMKVYRAIESGKTSEAERAVREFQNTMRAIMHTPFGEDLFHRREYAHFRDDSLEMLLHPLLHFMKRARHTSKVE